MLAPALRLAIVLSHPTQYYSPWFRWLRAQTGISLRVFYLWDFGLTSQRDRQFGTKIKWDTDLTGGYDWELVPNRSRDPGTHHFGGLENPGLPDRLAAYAPTALLVFGYNWNSHLRAIWWARRRGIPLLFRGDSHFLGRGTPALLRRLLLGLLYRQFSAVTYVGQANREYFGALGVAPGKLFFAPHSVDATAFDPANPALRAEADRMRRELGLEGKRVLLFAGKMTDRKQPRELLQTFLTVASPEHALVFVGEGPEKPALEALASTQADRTVRFLPFANQSEMPSRYLMADIFVLPSRGFYETWGLAVNEAMHLGVPCLVSDLVGCQRDLVVPGETGWVFPASDMDALATTLRRALEIPDAELARLRTNCLARIAGYTYEQTTAGLMAALAYLKPA